MSNKNLTMQVQTLSAAGAKVALAAAEKAAADQNLKLSIAVVDVAGNLVAFTRMDGASVTSVEAAMGKAKTSAYLRAPTKAFQDLLHGGATVMLAFRALTPAQGAVPLIVDGVVVGGIGGSGGTGEEDEMAAAAGAAALVAASR